MMSASRADVPEQSPFCVIVQPPHRYDDRSYGYKKQVSARCFSLGLSIPRMQNQALKSGQSLILIPSMIGMCTNIQFRWGAWGACGFVEVSISITASLWPSQTV